MKLIPLTVVFMLVSAICPGQVDLPPTADTWVDSANVAKNYGTDPTLKFGRLYLSSATNPLYRTYLQFNLQPFKGRKLAKAQLRIYEYGGHAAGTLSKHLNKVTAPWSETAMTWTNKAPFGTRLKSFSAGGSYRGWITLDVTAQVQAWIDGKETNYGFVLKHPTENQAGASRPAYCHSRESTQTSLRPVLRLDLGIGVFGNGCGAPTAPTISYIGNPAQGNNFSVTLAGAKPMNPAFLCMGYSDKTWNTMPLPLDLSFLGYKGCVVLTNWLLLNPRVTDSSGKASTSYPIPTSPLLVGAVIYWQWVVPIPRVGGFNLALTPGLRATVY